MLKSFLTVIVCLVITLGYSQEYQFGLFGGVSGASMSTTDGDLNKALNSSIFPSFKGGIYYQDNLAGKTDLLFELYFHRKGARFEQDDIKLVINSNYIHAAVSANFDISNSANSIIRGGLGVYMGPRLSTEEYFKVGTDETPSEIPFNQLDFDFGFMVYVGIELKAVTIDLRFHRGIIDVGDSNDGVSVFHQELASLNFYFPIIKS